MSDKVTIKITVKGGVKGSESGLELHTFEEGKEYTVTPDFAGNLVRGGLAEYVGGEKAAEKPAEAQAEQVAESQPEAEAQAAPAPAKKEGKRGK